MHHPSKHETLYRPIVAFRLFHQLCQHRSSIEPALGWYFVFDFTHQNLTSVALAPVAETCFSHRLTAYKVVGHFFGLSYLNISGNNQVENSFFRISNISVTCSHAHLRGRTVIKKLWTFFGPWGRDRSQSPPCWIFRVRQKHQSTASERTTRQCGRQILTSKVHPPTMKE